MIEGAISGMNALHELSLRTGTTVEALSALKGVAKQSGTDMDSIATGLQKLSKNIVEAESGTGKAAKAFSAMGIQLQDASGKTRASQDVMQEIAGKLSAMEDKTLAVAYAQELLGKSGANLLPFLQQLSEAGTLHGKVTADQAKAAHEFEVNLARLQSAGDAWKRELANAMVPSMNEWMEQLLKAKELTGGLYSALFMLATINPWLTHQQNLASYKKDLEDIAVKQAKYANNLPRVEALDAQAKVIQARIDYLKFLQRQEIETAGRGEDYTDQNDRSLARSKRFTPAPIAAKSDVSQAGLTPYQMELNKLIDQLRKVESEGSIAAQVLHSLNAGDFGTVTDAERARLLNLAARIQYTRELAADQKKMEEENTKLMEAAARHEEQRNAELDREAEHYRNILDPLKKYGDEIKKIALLVNESKLSSDEGDALLLKTNQEMVAAQNRIGDAMKTNNDIGRQLGLTMSSAFESAVIGGKSFRDVLSGIDRDIAQIVLRKTITEPLGNAVTGAISGSGIGDFLKGILPSFAVGTDYVPHDMVAQIHQGERILTAAENAAGGGAGGGMNVTINVGSLDPRTAASVIMANMPLIVGGINQAYNSRGQYGPLGR
jgi:hypothetical protein